MHQALRSPLPGFDTLRLLGALSVIFSHSYLITQDTEATEPLQWLLRGEKNIIGLYGVFTFFIISGFLLARSLHRNPSMLRFAVNRGARLLPGFWCCILFCAFVIGPVCSNLGMANYFASPELIYYLKQSFTTLSDAPLPGVFQYTGSVAQIVNGSLWSLRAEVACYALLMTVWSITSSAGLTAITFGAVGAVILINPSVLSWMPEFGYPLPYFAAGVVIWWLTHHLGDSRSIMQLCLAGMVSGAILGFPHEAYAVCGAYLVVYVGCRPTPLTPCIERLGDLSYGLYLFGWPVQQLIRQWLDIREPLVMFVLSAVLTACLAWFLFHGVEKPAMGIRQPLFAWLSRSSPCRIG